jgi:nucleotide-binding universal stress UspA family protein
MEAAMFQRILVPTDLTDESRQALDLALSLASPADARIILLHVIERIPNLDDRELRTFYDQLERDSRSRLHTLAGSAHRPGNVEIEQSVLFGRRAEEIVRTAEDSDCDLVILKHSMADTPLLGSISYKVSVLAPCSVLLLK